LLSHSTSFHLHQLYTGFSILHKRRAIRLSQHIVENSVAYLSEAHHLKAAGHAHLTATLNGRVRLHYDTHDSSDLALNDLQESHYYFKRSYSPAVVKQLPDSQQQKVFPLGLNYRVLPDSIDRFAIQRGFRLNPAAADRLTAMLRTLDVRNILGFQPRLTEMQSLPDYQAEPKVLFLVTAYDPFDNSERSEDKSNERREINETRAACIRLLKKELGSRFLGGFMRNPYTEANYQELIAPDKMTVQSSYLRLVRSFPICVATMGLHGSTGWKLAEYVAFAKAILSERPQYDVPGDFTENRNYLAFETPDECVNKAVQLIEDSELRSRLMTNNACYYQAFVRPDALVLNTLLTAWENYYK
jgi:hypothetical protein